MIGHPADTDQPHRRGKGRGEGRGEGRGKRLVVWALACTGLGAAAFLAGFAFFISLMTNYPTDPSSRADGIVALTGGAERITDAVDILAHGRARRLLITGVNPSITSDQVASQAPGRSAAFHCCVDLDHRALNTEGNAEETRRWAHARQMRSLLVVTSSYHMPRTLVELRRRLPDIILIPAPVVTERLRPEGLLNEPGMMRLLLVEYSKFVVAYARARLTSLAPADDIVTAAAPPRS